MTVTTVTARNSVFININTVCRECGEERGSTTDGKTRIPVRACSVHRKKLSLQSALENYISVSHRGLRPWANLFESRNKRVYDYRQFGNAIWQQISRRTTEVSASLHRKLLSLDRPHTPLEDLHSLAVSSLCAGRSRFTTRFILYKPQGGTQGTSYFWRLWRRGNTLSRDSNRPYFASITVGCTGPPELRISCPIWERRIPLFINRYLSSTYTAWEFHVPLFMACSWLFIPELWSTLSLL